MSFVLGGADSGISQRPLPYGGRAPGRLPGPRPSNSVPRPGGPAPRPQSNCGGPGQSPCTGGQAPSGNYIMTGCAPQPTEGVVGDVVDVLTSRPIALLAVGILGYLLVKSPAARKELGMTARSEYGRAKSGVAAYRAKRRAKASTGALKLSLPRGI